MLDLCSWGQPCFRLKPTAKLWHNLRPLCCVVKCCILFTLQLRLRHQFIDWTILIERLDIGIIYILYINSQINFQQILTICWFGHWPSLHLFHLSWPTTELASLSASPKGLGISKNFGADATLSTNPTCSQIANYILKFTTWDFNVQIWTSFSMEIVYDI